MARLLRSQLSARACAAAVVLAAALLSGCAAAPYRAPAPMPDDRRDIPQPRERSVSIAGELAENTVIRQMRQMFDVARGARFLTGHEAEAMNVDAFDEVANSSWFTNRNHRERMSIDAFRRGPDTGAGPELTSWEIFRAKLQGYTPGFSVIDGRGERYVIKFDPADHPELISGAEVVSTKFFYAAGYFTPENYIVEFDPSILRLGDNVKFVDERGKRRAMTRDDIDAILARVPRMGDGRIRALASKYIDGVPLGPFKYNGTRDDDPNDFIPHHQRRELRGLRMVAAWLCHFDTKSGNSFDAYVTENGRSYVRHYLIDFGSTLGCGAVGPVHRFRGHENDFDPHAIAFNAITGGVYVRPYEKLQYPPYPSIGLYESALFEPQEYKFQSPNPAFENMTDRDGFWGAKIVMSFTDEQVHAAVEAARYSDPEAAAYLERTLIERRDKVGRYYFGRVNPLDRFALDGRTLTFDDLAVESGLEREGTYRYSVGFEGENLVDTRPVDGGRSLELPAPGGAGQFECVIETSRDGRKWSKPVRVYVDADGAGGLRITGLRRDS